MPTGKWKTARLGILTGALSAGLLIALSMPVSAIASGNVKVQCPGDTNGDAVIDVVDPLHPDAVCKHLGGGDGFATMADGTVLYIFGFNDLTGVPEDEAMMAGMLAAQLPAPPVVIDEGDEFFLTLTNIGMMMRPDLFDAHTVHFHGFGNAASVFDGVPDSSISINMGASITYYYNMVSPTWTGAAWTHQEEGSAGTYMYHCHVEATEHMEMGMLGSLWVRPAQNRLPDGTMLGAWQHHNPDWNATRRLDDPLVGDKYAYDDGDGSTRYDVEYALLLESMDRNFHEQHLEIQPLPFADLKDDYPMINGRGYPDTLNPAALPAPDIDPGSVALAPGAPKVSQQQSSLITASAGQRILLRVANLNITRFNSMGTTGLPMKVVAKDAKLLRGPTGLDLSYNTTAFTLGGGESMDVIIDTSTVAPGEYYLYSTNLDQLKNDQERFGGMMTKIIITP